MAKWELMHEVIKNLGRGWTVDASGLQDLGFFAGLASGPDGMRLFFAARTENLDSSREHSYPPFGWLRVDGRLHFSDNDLSANLSIELRQTLTPAEIAHEIIARLLPVYSDFLSAVAKRNPQNQSSEERPPEPVEAQRKTLTEQQAASSFVRCMLEESARAWPSTYESLKECSGNKFVVEDEKMASFHWRLAAISLSLQGVRNLFPPEQASRIEKWIFTEMKDNRAIDEVKQYDAAFQKGQAEELGPLGGVPGRLVDRWLGKNIRNCEAEIQGNKTGFIDVLVMLETERVLTELAVSRCWKTITDLVETYSTPNEHDLFTLAVGHGKRILVSHEEAVNEAIEEILSSAGYEVRTTTHPSEVLGLAGDFAPDVALVKLVAPEINGLELSEELAARLPRVKIVIVGPFSDLELGAKQYLGTGHRVQVSGRSF